MTDINLTYQKNHKDYENSVTCILFEMFMFLNLLHKCLEWGLIWFNHLKTPLETFSSSMRLLKEMEVSLKCFAIVE